MSAKALFADGGDEYVPISVRIAEGKLTEARKDGSAKLSRSEVTAAVKVWNAIVQFLPRGKADLRITDSMLQRSEWLHQFSLRYVQKGLKALEDIRFIERERRRGLRRIIVLARIRGKSTKSSPTSKHAQTPGLNQIPNVGTIPMATPEQVAAAAAAKQAAESTPANQAAPLDADAQEVFDRFFSEKRPRSGPL